MNDAAGESNYSLLNNNETNTSPEEVAIEIRVD